MSDTAPAPRKAPGIKIPPERLDAIEVRLLKAEAPADFVPILAKEWGRHKRKIWDYVARVRKRLAERARSAKLDPDADAELVRALLLKAYTTAQGRGDSKGMVSAAKALAEVTGVIGPRKLIVSGPNGGPIAHEVAQTTPEALHARLAGIAARAAGGPHPGAAGGAERVGSS